MSLYVAQVFRSSSWLPMPTAFPSSITTILSASIIVPILWATMIEVTPEVSLFSALRRLRSVLKSRAEKESSKM